jgi:N-acetylneuraminic acid mutarotase
MGQNTTEKTDLWEYNPETNKWTEKKDFPGEPRYAHMHTSLAYFVANNKAYVLYERNMWEYNPVTDSWTPKANCPTSPVYGAGVNNKGYVSFFSYTYEYNPETDTWKQCTDFPGQNRYEMAVASTEQNAYIIAGSTDNDYRGKLLESDNFWVYNPTNDRWSQKADFPLRVSHAIAFCREGVIYAGLGCSYYYAGSSYYRHKDSYHNSIYRYDADNNKWVLFTTVPSALERHSAISVMCNGKLYVGLGAGGAGGANDYFLDFWEYSF